MKRTLVNWSMIKKADAGHLKEVEKIHGEKQGDDSMLRRNFFQHQIELLIGGKN
ncbi:MAG: hypothetical protein ABF649_03695 [Bacillus sp. (in: firmicutes)]